MTLKDITRDSVLDAMAEYDRLGPSVFLAEYGFELGEYFIEWADRRYASKAIAGVAHGYATGTALAAKEFSGGAQAVQPILERLGFQIVHEPKRNRSPVWTREELILACDLVVANGWQELRTNNPKVQELSRLLRAMKVHPQNARPANFRSPDAVSRKTTDLMTAHPDYGRARTRGGKTDRAVVDDFIKDPVGMHEVANQIRSVTRVPDQRLQRRSGVAEGLTVEHIDTALQEWWLLGRDKFMNKYAGRPAERYVVTTKDGDVDALSLVLGARSLAGMDVAGSWRGDRQNVAEPLRRLGFRVKALGRAIAPEVEAAEDAVHQASGQSFTRSQVGQGFSIDQKSKLAVEAHAMKVALEHYEPQGEVHCTATRESWDYEVTRGGDCWHVEVKGTTGEAADVILTPNEVAHARNYPFLALFVVSNIDVSTTGPGDQRTASGGQVLVYDPWTLDEDDLRPLGYKYSLPKTGHELD